MAKTALSAALESIRSKGGGLVEAYGRTSPQVEEYLGRKRWPEVNVAGVGPVRAIRGTFGNVSNSGTVSMFEAEGFKAESLVGNTNVLMRKQVPRTG